MSPTDIIQIPGHPGMWAMRFVVEMWIASGSPRVNDAGRLHGQQKYLYDGWRAGVPGFYPADNPDNPNQPRAHLRGFALDITPTPARVAALTAAGFYRPYSYEPHHWEPRGRNVWAYPIIHTLPAFASSGAEDFIPPPKPTRRGRTMFVTVNTPGEGGAVRFHTSEGSTHVFTPHHRDILVRVISHNPEKGPLELLNIEQDIFDMYVQAAAKSGDRARQAEIFARILELDEKLAQEIDEAE